MILHHQTDYAMCVRGLIQIAGLPFEIRAINLNAGREAPTYSCIFDHYPTQDELKNILPGAPSGYTFFVNIQQAVADLPSRYPALSKGKLAKAYHNTNDTDITHYRWLPIDTDTIRAEGYAGQPSTKQELAATEKQAQRIMAAMEQLGFSQPVYALSANGYHILYRIDLEATTENKVLIGRVLRALAFSFDSAAADIDKKVNNPSRVLKLYGTVAKKGQETAERPYRQSKILSAPKQPEVNGKALLYKLLEKYEEQEPPEQLDNTPEDNTSTGEGNSWNLQRYLDGRGIPYKQVKPNRPDTIFKAYVACPNAAAHTSITSDKDSYVWQNASGAKGFNCSHSHCVDIRFRQWRLSVEPEAYNKVNKSEAQAAPQPPLYKVVNRTQGKPVFVADNPVDFEALSYHSCYAVLVDTRKSRAAFVENIKLKDDEEREALLFVFTFQDRESIKALEATRDCAFYDNSLLDGYDSIAERNNEDVDQLGQELNAPLAEWQSKYLASKTNAAYLPSFTADINSKKDYIKTGFNSLDTALGGGLIPSLTVIGAMPALGKTAFVLQMADHIAAAGRPVLYFSLEMGKAELISRSISRGTFKRQPRDRVDLACTNQEILMGEFNAYTDRQLLVRDVMQDYQEHIANNLYVFEGVGDITIGEIRHNVEKHIVLTGQLPVVVIDYLQIVKNDNDKLTDKQVIDRAATELKRMSRDLQLVILVITSYNRASYDKEASMAASKESGAIEYTADNLLDLHHARPRHKSVSVRGEDGEEHTLKEPKAEYEQRIADLMADNEQRIKDGRAIKVGLKLLKCRNGARANVYFAYTKKYHYYTDSGMALIEFADDFTDEEIEERYEKKKPSIIRRNKPKE